MKVIALSPVTIKSSKTGLEYVKVSFISEQGASGELFLDKVSYDALRFPVTKTLNSEDVKELFEKFDVVDVEFDQRGKCVSAK